METIANTILGIGIKTDFLMLKTKAGELIFDIQLAFSSGNTLIGINEVTDHYKKRFRNWVRLKTTQKFIRAMETRSHVSVFKKNGYKGGYVADDSLDNDFTSPLIKRKIGRYGGTYIHENILLDYLMWLDIDLKVDVHLFLKQLISQLAIVKRNRTNTKTQFHKLKEVIEEVLTPIYYDKQIELFERYKKIEDDTEVNKKQKDEALEKWSRGYTQYEHLKQEIFDAINIRVIGMKANKFRRLNNIPITTNILTRDYFNGDTLRAIEVFQAHVRTLILSGITDLDELKIRIQNIPLDKYIY